MAYVSFEDLVSQVLDELPEEFARQMENVVISVEDEPSSQDLEAAGVAPDQTLLGLYTGVPLTERGAAGSPTPDVIRLFRGPIERAASYEPDRMRFQLHRTLLHEVAHFFGISDEHLHELDRY